jgi:hypothetical protein
VNGNSGREEKKKREKKERTREKKKMQQIFLYMHADVLYVCRHCTDPDINFTEEHEHTHARKRENERTTRETLSSSSHFFVVYV